MRVESGKRKVENGERKRKNFPLSTSNFPLFICLAIMAASLTLSPFMMGASQFFLMAVWLFTGDPIKVKLQRFIHNKVAVVLVSLFLLHLVGLIYTSAFAYAFKDLRVKLPLLILPMVLSSVKPLDKKYFDLLMLIYVASVFVATCISFGYYLKNDYGDIREISHFISHIRFCLNIVLSMGILIHYIFEKRITTGKVVPAFSVKTALNHYLMWFLLFWFVYQLYIFESLSGYLAFAGLVVASLLYLYFTKVRSTAWKAVGLAVVIAVPILAGVMLYRTVDRLLRVEPIDFSTLDRTTALGNDYWHDTICFPVEDGRYIGLYFCRSEMREAWNRRSELDYDGLTHNGENLEATLARYLTSKNLRKDAAGVDALCDEDIHNVENGVANYKNFIHPGVRARLSETAFEYNQYRRYNNPNGGSLSQRIEYTRASFYLIKKHPLFGVGTGDIPEAYRQAYNDLSSPLEEQYRHRAHNQYLSITVGFGLIGLIIFLVTLLFPYCSAKCHRTYLYTIFLVIVLLSMLPEDTIETQAGVTWFALFNSLLIFATEKGKETPEKQ